MLVRDGLGHEGDSKDNEAGGDEQDDGEVEVVDATDDGGTVAGLGAAARPIGELCDHSGEADAQADDEAPECSLQRKGFNKDPSYYLMSLITVDLSSSVS